MSVRKELALLVRPHSREVVIFALGVIAGVEWVTRIGPAIAHYLGVTA